MTRTRRFGAMLGCCIAASAVLVGHAWAGQIFHERFHDEGTFVYSDFCGAGLPVEETWDTDGTVRAVQRGPNGFAYFAEHFKQTVVFTNPTNGKAVTAVETVNGKELKVTDNGDGTLTVLFMATGNAVLYGADGKAIGRNPGQSRIELLIDHGGTPTDPSDDKLISVERVKGSTGRTDDFCSTAVPALS